MSTQTMEYATAAGMLRIERDLQEITDAHGHVHAYIKRAAEVAYQDTPKRARKRARKGKPPRTHFSHYPTLIWVVDIRRRCDGRETLYSHDPHWVEEGHYECRQCREVIRPGYGPGSKMIPLRETYLLNGEIIPKDRFYEIVNAHARRLAGAEQEQAAQRVAGSLGYPPGFMDPP